MARVNPFHSKKHPGKYHVCSKCTEGDNIQPKYKRQGTGGGKMCERCKDLIRLGRC